MTRDAVGAALFVLGVFVARLVVTGEYLVVVKESLAVPLLLSAALLVVLGGAALLEGARGRTGPAASADGHADGHDHDEHGGHGHVGVAPRMGLLLLAPVAALLLVPVTPLGSFASANGAANRIDERTTFDDLPEAVDGAVPLDLDEVASRAVLAPATVAGTPLRTLGFVAPAGDLGDGYLLSRFTAGCCAIDAAPFQVLVVGDGLVVPPVDTWVEAVVEPTGEVRERGGDRLPVVRLVRQARVDEPRVPYLY